MRVERAAGEADVDRSVVAEPSHELLTAAEHADGQAAAEALPVGDQVGLDAEILLRAAEGEPEADEDLIEDQDDMAFAADGPQSLEPIGVRLAVEMGGPCTVDQRRIRRRIRIRMQGL